MKSKYIHMSMLIQGPKQPGNNINLYLGLLQEELDALWKTPAKTWDASKGEYFYMRAALITTVHDYLGYEDGSNRTTRGQTMEIYSMVTLSIEDPHVSGAVPKSMSC